MKTNNKSWKNHRAEPYFTFVKNGIKTIETRIRKGKYRLIRPGDHILVYNPQETDSFEVKVLGVRNYKSFRELFENEPLKKIVPDVETTEQAIKIIYERFYTKEEEKKFGVVAIEVQRVDNE